MFYLVALGLFVLCYLFLASDEIKKKPESFCRHHRDSFSSDDCDLTHCPK